MKKLLFLVFLVLFTSTNLFKSEIKCKAWNDWQNIDGIQWYHGWNDDWFGNRHAFSYVRNCRNRDVRLRIQLRDNDHEYKESSSRNSIEVNFDCRTSEEPDFYVWIDGYMHRGRR